MGIERISVLGRAIEPLPPVPPSIGAEEAFSFVGPSAPRDFAVVRHALLGASPLGSYSHFVRSGVQSLIHQINSYRDRGLIASPVGGRDIFESFFAQ